MSTARARGEKPGAREPGTVSRTVALLIAVATLIIGGLIGYVARGGPDQPDQLQVTQPVPVVTVTVTKP
jgi:hypothetical protein